jgi:putative acetyltransferase
VNFVIAPIQGAEADHLLVRSDHYMSSLYPAESNHLVSSESLRTGDALFLGMFTSHLPQVSSSALNEEPPELDSVHCVGCVAARFYREQTYAEIKRLYVDEDYRGRGLAKTLMVEIESGILEQGIDCARLEMGIYQPEADALYRSMGYREITPFGDYLLDPLSQFLEKSPLSR